MNEFRLLTRTRQITEYSCGASALQAVLHYWGHDIEETKIMEMIGTTSEVGSYPENIVKGVRALGLEAEARDNLTLDELRKFGHPVIALAQVWRSQRSSTARPEDDWEDGHYITVTGVDDKYVYFQDPFTSMTKGFVTHKTFERHWHQIMGGVATKNPKLVHLGIFIRGKQPAPPPAATTAKAVEKLDFSKLSSINLMVTDYPKVLLPFDIMDELRNLWTNDAVRPDAFLYICKDADGEISALEGGKLQHADEVPEVNALLATLMSRRVRAAGLEDTITQVKTAIESAVTGDFGLGQEDILIIAEQMPREHTKVIMLIENTWERRFREVVQKYGGTLIDQELISPRALAEKSKKLLAKNK